MSAIGEQRNAWSASRVVLAKGGNAQILYKGLLSDRRNNIEGSRRGTGKLPLLLHKIET